MPQSPCRSDISRREGFAGVGCLLQAATERTWIGVLLSNCLRLTHRQSTCRLNHCHSTGIQSSHASKKVFSVAISGILLGLAHQEHDSAFQESIVHSLGDFFPRFPTACARPCTQAQACAVLALTSCAVLALISCTVLALTSCAALIFLGTQVSLANTSVHHCSTKCAGSSTDVRLCSHRTCTHEYMHVYKHVCVCMCVHACV